MLLALKKNDRSLTHVFITAYYYYYELYSGKSHHKL